MSDERDQNSAIGTNLVVFLLGVAVGATVAVLYAPAAGSDTRHNIADKASQLKDKANELGHQVADRAGEWKEKVSTKMRGSFEPADSASDGAQV
jgi:gas vesicle protein